jgi:hypothetical protein
MARDVPRKTWARRAIYVSILEVTRGEAGPTPGSPCSQERYKIRDEFLSRLSTTQLKHHQHRHVHLQVLRCNLLHRRCACRSHRSVLPLFVLPHRLTRRLDRSAKRSPDAGGLSARQGGLVDGLLTGPGGLLNGLLNGVLGGSPANDLDARQIGSLVNSVTDDLGNTVKGVTGAIGGRQIDDSLVDSVTDDIGDIANVVLRSPADGLNARQLPDGVDVNVDILGIHLDRRQADGLTGDVVAVVDATVDTVDDQLPGDA